MRSRSPVTSATTGFGPARARRWITPKTSGYNPTRIDSPYQAVLFNRAGRQLGSYAIDLSQFDLDPARVGKPLRVTGCEVRDTKVAAIVNVPYLANARSIEIRRAGRRPGVRRHACG